MRQIQCDDCARRPLHENQPLRVGTYELYAATASGEPAEMARVVQGVARQPTAAQRTIHVNDTPHPLSTDVYNCDRCNGEIRPGDAAWCLTVWQPALQSEPARWEETYLTPNAAPRST